MEQQKYIDVEDVVTFFGDRVISSTITLKCLIDFLRDAQPAKVIPESYIRAWYKDHYGIKEDPAILTDYYREMKAK